TAEYGDLTRGKKVINENTRKIMKGILEDIQSGKFAKEWIKENEKGRPLFSKMRQREDKHPIEEIGRKLRRMMPWMQE
ncbi:MAG: ketol-acid reductoisomerase, partial [Candidatus Omnitrophica bacterium]|nr:ketol-acid reductoisomerase [Candidatus Omnitrophota bacterium]